MLNRNFARIMGILFCIISSGALLFSQETLQKPEKEYILETMPDIVIREMVERQAGSLPHAAFD